ncbi:endonuclease/exonuclease/phosphatase family protein [Geodermatophilus sp. SYSU D00684]
MRIGTWNLFLRAQSPTELWKRKAAWLHEQPADLWLLTETSTEWRSQVAPVSPLVQVFTSLKRGIGPESLRWAAIQTTLPTGELRTKGDPDHPGEESLVLSRVRMGGRSALAACSVLPYRGADKDWGRLTGSHSEQFRFVLKHHVARIADERESKDEPLIWGGDFNQELVRPYMHGQVAGAAELHTALETLGLTVVTAGLSDRKHQGHAIDHVAVSSHFMTEQVQLHRPERAGESLGDHAAYTTVVNLLGT